MAEIDFLLDENVPSPLYNALVSKGYNVEYAQDRYGEGTDDYDQLLTDSGRDGFVLITNDMADFSNPPETITHSGVLLYSRASLISNRTGDALDAIERILSQYSDDELKNETVWITEWL
jgi:hypothetical protein